MLLRELAAEVKNFMDFKRNAVMVSAHIHMYIHILSITVTANQCNIVMPKPMPT